MELAIEIKITQKTTLDLNQEKRQSEMSTPKRKSSPSNPQLVSDGVTMKLPKLIDSAVMEVTTQKFTLQPQKINETNVVDSLPDEIIVKVFHKLTHNELGQIATVCKRWYWLTKDPVLWKKVNVKFSPLHSCQTYVATSFINRLSSCAISVRLDFMKCDDWINPLDFAELCRRLQEKCPHLEELILVNSDISTSLSSVIGVCAQWLQDVKNLIFHDSTFNCNRLTQASHGTSKIEILELFNCDDTDKPPFSKMPHLKQLHLSSTSVDSWFEDGASFLRQLQVLNLENADIISARIFQAIQNHGINLEKLYISGNGLQDHEITLNNSAFPRLKTICLCVTWVTCKGVVSLIQSCPSLEDVYVDEYVAQSFAKHPFVAANRCKAGIVKVIDEEHEHSVDYLQS